MFAENQNVRYITKNYAKAVVVAYIDDDLIYITLSNGVEIETSSSFLITEEEYQKNVAAIHAERERENHEQLCNSMVKKIDRVNNKIVKELTKSYWHKHKKDFALLNASDKMKWLEEVSGITLNSWNIAPNQDIFKELAEQALNSIYLYLLKRALVPQQNL